jgi:glucosamine-6-phosphate deaminase
MKSNLENKPDISYESPGKFEDTRFEKIHNVLFKTRQKPLLLLEIADLIKAKQQNKENCVLGLATGSSPIMVYEELVRMHREEGLSFSNVITFNLDEYYPMRVDNNKSYYYASAQIILT